MKYLIVALAAIIMTVWLVYWDEHRLRQTQPDKRETEVAQEANKLHKCKGLRVVVARADGSFRIVVDGGAFVADSNVRIGDLYK